MEAERQATEGAAPHGRWRTLAFLAAPRHDRLTAPAVSDGPINAVCFRAYVEQQPIPTLEPGDIVILDNLGGHKSKAVRQVVEAAGARLRFPPKYSPDLDSIEQAFAGIKHWMRIARRRTVEDTWRHIGVLVGGFTPTECENHFVNAGYDSVKT